MDNKHGALPTNERMFRDAQRIARFGTWEWDIKTGEVQWSEGVYHIFGLDPETFHPTIDFILALSPPEERGRGEELIQKAINDHSQGTYEQQFFRPDGSAGVYVSTFEGVYDDEGALVRMSGVAHDVTEQKEIEKRLRQSEKMQAIGQLAGGVAHDFNNQLTVILGYAEILKKKVCRTASETTMFENLCACINHSRALVQQLLAFSRKGRMQSVVVDLHAIVQEVGELLTHTIDRKIAVSMNLHADHPCTQGDPSQIQNAILNVALNARDAMPEGGEIIFSSDVVRFDECHCNDKECAAGSGAYVHIAITDSGCGMGEDVRKHIFEPFFTTKGEKGVGMGLAAVYGTMQEHKGTITCYSECGSGTTMNLYFPCVVAESDTHTESLTAHLEEVFRGEGRILFIDDNEMICQVASALLSDIGYQVEIFQNPADAIEFYTTHWQDIDLVIHDMIMPGINGYELFRSLKDINPQIKAVVSSGYSINGDAQKILDDGACGFIQKPFSIARISKIVYIALQQ